MTIALYTQDLSAFPAARARALDQRLRSEGLDRIEAVYALVWPDYGSEAQTNLPKLNRERFAAWRNEAGVPLWGWFNAREDQDADADALYDLDRKYLAPSGWLLDIEGEWTKTAKLDVLCSLADALGRPVRASLAGSSASHVNTDFRTLDRLGIPVEWQAYFDSGEGPTPAQAVAELYSSSFVIPGWPYRHRLGSVYGWGKVTRVEQAQRAVFDSFKRPGLSDATFSVGPRQWGNTVVSRTLMRDGQDVGLLMGRAAYTNIRVALDVTRTAASRTPEEWTPIAASARWPGFRKRPVSVYLAEVTSDDVIVAIAKGAA